MPKIFNCHKHFSGAKSESEKGQSSRKVSQLLRQQLFLDAIDETVDQLVTIYQIMLQNYAPEVQVQQHYGGYGGGYDDGYGGFDGPTQGRGYGGSQRGGGYGQSEFGEYSQGGSQYGSGGGYQQQSQYQDEYAHKQQGEPMYADEGNPYNSRGQY